MYKYTELNLESGMPTVKDALDTLKFSIDLYRKDKIECVLVIHGYGSSGKGGSIGVSTRKWLFSELKNNRLKAVIQGEDFNIFTPHVIELKNKYKELEPLLKICNHGVTVVML